MRLGNNKNISGRVHCAKSCAMLGTSNLVREDIGNWNSSKSTYLEVKILLEIGSK